MAGVRCPKCRVVLPDGQRRAARCPACHEPLEKCRYCRSYDFDIQDCTNLTHREVDRVIDPDEIVNCPAFSSRLIAKTAPRRRRLLRQFIMLVLIAGVLTGTIIYLTRRAPSPTATLPFQMSASVSEDPLKEDGVEVSMSLLNSSDFDIKNLEIRIAGRGIRALTLETVTPPEALVNTSPSGTTLGVAELLVGDHCSLSIHFLANRTGRIPLMVTATTPMAEGSVVQSLETNVIP